jgi:hypothetical protein
VNTKIGPAFPPPPALSEELAAVEHDYPGFHCWHSDQGVAHATTCECHDPEGCGTTLTAPTPALLRHEIAAQVREWAVAA